MQSRTDLARTGDSYVVAARGQYSRAYEISNQLSARASFSRLQGTPVNPPTDIEAPFRRSPRFVNNRLRMLGLGHIPILVGACFFAKSTELFAFIFAVVPLGLTLHGIALIRAGEWSTRWRSIGRGLVAALACLFGWALFFLIMGVLFQDSNILMVGIVASFPLALFTSGLGAALRIAPFSRAD